MCYDSGIIYKEEKSVYVNVRVRREILTEPYKLKASFVFVNA